VALSPDGKIILTGSEDGTARLWIAATGKPAHPPLMHRSPVGVVVFSPDGKTAITATKDKTAQLWDVATGKPIGPPLPCGAVPPGVGLTVATLFRPDGRAVLTGSSDGAHLWAVPAALAGDAYHIRLWVEVITGMELDASGAVVELNAKTWRERWDHLQKLGAPAVK
jgi:WD40 repeat protein